MISPLACVTGDLKTLQSPPTRPGANSYGDASYFGHRRSTSGPRSETADAIATRKANTLVTFPIRSMRHDVVSLRRSPEQTSSQLRMLSPGIHPERGLPVHLNEPAGVSFPHSGQTVHAAELAPPYVPAGHTASAAHDATKRSIRSRCVTHCIAAVIERVRSLSVNAYTLSLAPGSRNQTVRARGGGGREALIGSYRSL